MEVFDFEVITLNGKSVPYAFAYSDGGNYIYELVDVSIDNLILLILKCFKPGLVYYAHNLLFDFWYMMRSIITHNLRYEWVFIDYQLYAVDLWYKNRKYYFRCSYRLLPFALERFYPELSSRPKLFFPYQELKDWDSGRSLSKYSSEILFEYRSLNLGQYLKVYTLRDALVLKSGILNFWKTLGFLNIKSSKYLYSIGQISLKYYIKAYNQISFKGNFKTQLGEAYMGGRCEVFGNPHRNEKILHFDFAGMYQHCMGSDLPYNRLVFETLQTGKVDRPGFYYIKLTYATQLPVLPVKLEKLIFPAGVIQGWYWWEEIIVALEVSEVSAFEVYAGIIATDYGPILRDFVDNLALIRDAGGIKRDVGKLLINSFYGRLGMKSHVNKIILEEQAAADCLTNFRMNGRGWRLRRKTVQRKPKNNLAVAAAITAKARIRLFKALKSVEGAGGRLLYCDTDSVFAAFPKELSVENRWLGEVYFDTSLRDTVVDDALFISPKSYILRMGDKTIYKIKGVSTVNHTFAEIKNIFMAGGDISANSIVFDKNIAGPGLWDQPKILNSRIYSKRRWVDTYTNTVPRVLNQAYWDLV